MKNIIFIFILIYYYIITPDGFFCFREAICQPNWLYAGGAMMTMMRTKKVSKHVDNYFILQSAYDYKKA